MLSNPLPPPAARLAPPLRSLAAALLIALFPIAAGAATIVVTSPDDTDPGAGGTCTLRQAIVSMNTGALAGNCAASDGEDFGVHDAIRFAASALTAAATPGTVTLSDSSDATGAVGGTLVISDGRLTIDGEAWRGEGAGQYPDGVTIARPAGASQKFGVIRNIAAAGGQLELKSLAIRNGDAQPALCDGLSAGGGVCMVAADLSMADSRVSGNAAGFAGAGIASPNGALALVRCTIDANGAYRGGGVYSGNGVATVTASTISGNNGARGAGLYSGTGSATVTTSTISGNGDWYTSEGSGIHAGGMLEVVDSEVSGNLGREGAGIKASGTLTLTRSVVDGNQSYYSSSGILVSAGGSATVTGSTIHNNFARYNGAGVFVEGSLTVVDSTIAGNSCYRVGGGIFLATTATLHLDQATLARNTCGSGGGIGGTVDAGSATIDRSIVSDNKQSTGSDIDAGIAWSGSDNLIASPDTVLGPLQDNGGPTPTMLPGPASAAIDAIPVQECAEPIDQRGIARPQGAGCDIGAVEIVVDVIFADGFDGD